MVAGIVKLALGPETQWEAERIADIFNALLKQYKKDGFRYTSFLADYDNGEYQGIIYWNTREQAEQAIHKLMPLLREMVKHECQWEPSVELFQVYEPRSVHIDSQKYDPLHSDSD